MSLPPVAKLLCCPFELLGVFPLDPHLGRIHLMKHLGHTCSFGGEGLPPLNSFFLWNPCTQAGCPAELRISWHCWGTRSSHSCSYVKYFCPWTNVLEIFLDSIYRLSPGCWLDPSDLWGLANKELVDPVRGQPALLPAQHRHLVFPV